MMMWQKIFLSLRWIGGYILVQLKILKNLKTFLLPSLTLLGHHHRRRPAWRGGRRRLVGTSAGAGFLTHPTTTTGELMVAPGVVGELGEQGRRRWLRERGGGGSSGNGVSGGGFGVGAV
jgi:hypothetical protein